MRRLRLHRRHLDLVDVECPTISQNTPGDPGELVGQGCRQLVFMHALRRLLKPWAKAELLPIVRSHQNDVGGLHEQRSQVSTALF